MTAIHSPFERESALDVIVRMSPTQFFLPDHAIADVGTEPPRARPAAPSLWAAMTGALRRAVERFDRWAWEQQMRDREAWLAQSADVFELEQRLRDIERGDWRY